MNINQKNKIKNFFHAANSLKSLGIIRSTNYVGNIAEFMCANLYNLKLSESQREEGLDGIDSKGRKLEIKFHNGTSSTNIIMSKYSNSQNFNDLIVMLGPLSKIRTNNLPEMTYATYKIKDYSYKKHGNIAKTLLTEVGPDFILDEDLEVLKQSQQE
ncbi:DUF6998 domain-containing protein [Rossellomorea aquimaris]|uniref:DUF6998 domain-containing protein n=1 Tax=Rossellomorea aquimaris TaxID=189382 RepID=UPI0037C5017C